MKQKTEIYRTRKLSPETLERIKQWVQRNSICLSPHCGDKCIIEPGKEKLCMKNSQPSRSQDPSNT